MLRSNRFLSLFLATAVLASATGCDDDDDDVTAPVGEGRVRAIHAIGNAPAVDILAGGTAAIQDLAYTDASDYLTVSAGQVQLGVAAANTTTPLLTISPTVVDGTDYTFIAIGRLGATTGPTPRIAAITDNAAPPTGQASIRVVHGSPAAGNVDVYATTPDADIDTATPVLTNVPFGAIATPLNVAAGTYRFRVTPTNTKSVAIDVNNVTVAANTRYLAVAVGDDNPGTGTPSPLTILLFPENVNP